MRRPVSIIGAPLDLGQTRRGVDMGPSAIRYAGLEERLIEIGHTVTDRGNVIAPEPEALALVDERARFLPEILDACAQLASLVETTVRVGARRAGGGQRRPPSEWEYWLRIEPPSGPTGHLPHKGGGEPFRL